MRIRCERSKVLDKSQFNAAVVTLNYTRACVCVCVYIDMYTRVDNGSHLKGGAYLIGVAGFEDRACLEGGACYRPRLK